VLAYTRLLYDVERDARDMKLDSERRLALRRTRSVPILNDIKACLEREQPNVLPKSPEGQAFSYVLSNWDALLRYSEDGDLEIDNNGAERSLRGIAVGRKNWLFFGSGCTRSRHAGFLVPESCTLGRNSGLTPELEVGARCDSAARRDLCGGLRGTGVPTATQTCAHVRFQNWSL
jgi:hypothetical protein